MFSSTHVLQHYQKKPSYIRGWWLDQRLTRVLHVLLPYVSDLMYISAPLNIGGQQHAALAWILGSENVQHSTKYLLVVGAHRTRLRPVWVSKTNSSTCSIMHDTKVRFRGIYM